MSVLPDYYAVLGLPPDCSPAQVREAYRLIAKRLHPDVNGGSPESLRRMQELNAACATLSDPDQRAQYERQRVERDRAPRRARVAGRPAGRPRTQDAWVNLEELFRGTRLELTIDDAGNPDGLETYELVVPPGTMPGARLQLIRDQGPDRGAVTVRVRVRPHGRFKARGTDLRCDLRVTNRLAADGGFASLRGVLGNSLRVLVPSRVKRGEILRVSGEGLPNRQGGRGDLLVRILHQPEIRFRRRIP